MEEGRAGDGDAEDSLFVSLSLGEGGNNARGRNCTSKGLWGVCDVYIGAGDNGDAAGVVADAEEEDRDEDEDSDTKTHLYPGVLGGAGGSGGGGIIRLSTSGGDGGGGEAIDIIGSPKSGGEGDDAESRRNWVAVAVSSSSSSSSCSLDQPLLYLRVMASEIVLNAVTALPNGDVGEDVNVGEACADDKEHVSISFVSMLW